jgi:hypothetical protein
MYCDNRSASGGLDALRPTQFTIALVIFAAATSPHASRIDGPHSQADLKADLFTLAGDAMRGASGTQTR